MTGDVVAVDAANVLVVDDNPANIAVLERILRSGETRVAVHATSDATQVLALVADVRPDLILLDLHMPQMDGLAVLAGLRAALPPDEYLPVLVLTADVTRESRERVLAAGANDFLTKPFDRAEVLLRIRNLLQTRALHVRLQAHAQLLEGQVREQAERERRLERARRERADRIRDVLRGDGLTVVYQPIADLRTGAVAGVEALSRFAGDPPRPPDVWFNEASDVGLGPALELAAARRAVEGLEHLPSSAYVSVNLSPEALQSDELVALVTGTPPGRVVVELTEHARVDDYEALAAVRQTLRDHDVRLAVDDAGAGFASLRHILRLTPDIIKLDLHLTRTVDTDPAPRALARALVAFAAEIDAVLVAEGVETEEGLRVLRDLGIRYGQGYHLARPGPLPLPCTVVSHLASATA